MKPNLIATLGLLLTWLYVLCLWLRLHNWYLVLAAFTITIIFIAWSAWIYAVIHYFADKLYWHRYYSKQAQGE